MTHIIDKSPDQLYEQLFFDIQSSHIFIDDKTFLDMIPVEDPKYINDRYNLEKENSNFDLSDFVSKHFNADEIVNSLKLGSNSSVKEYIESYWKKSECQAVNDSGSILALPNSYIVPGGRFKEQFYWDSYFIMLGLRANDKWSTIEGMIDNAAYMIDKFGFIPTANRTYFLSRSQPPFFASMIELLAAKKGDEFVIKYLPYLLSEYEFWMKDSDKLVAANSISSGRVVMMPGGEILNRYYDNNQTPRPEAINGDQKIANEADWRNPSDVYLNLRAAAESGWDFSSRWFDNPMDIRTIQTVDIVPVDLNCLIYQMELTISKLYRLSGDLELSNSFKDKSNKRLNAINRYCWDDISGFYFDYNFIKNESTGRLTLAASFPLYFKIASQKQSELVASKLESNFLMDGGLVSTLSQTGQQWDSPNGWAPLQWIAIEGLRNYGNIKLADEIKLRWIKTNQLNFDKNSKLVEKYNVKNIDQPCNSNDYVLQDGFGWTNGVMSDLLNRL